MSKFQENERALAQLPLWKPLATGGVVWLAIQFVAPTDWSLAWWKVAQGATLLGVPVAYWLVVAHARRHSVRDVTGDAPSGKHLLLALGAVCASLAALLGWGSLLAWLGVLSAPGSPGPLSSATTPAHGVGLVSCTVVLAPLAEELLFRGLIFGKLLRYARPAVAALFSSVLFGAFHSSPATATLFGLLMVALYTRSRSLWLPIIAHFANNLVAVVLERAVMVNAISDADGPSPWVLLPALPLSLLWAAWFVRGALRSLDEAPAHHLNPTHADDSAAGARRAVGGS